MELKLEIKKRIFIQTKKKIQGNLLFLADDRRTTATLNFPLTICRPKFAFF